MSLIYLVLVVTVVGRYSAQQIASTERRFQCCIFNMYAESVFQSSAPHMLHEIPSLFHTDLR